MRIVHLSSSGQVGGVERVLLDLLAGVRAEEPGWSLQLVAPEEGPLTREARALGVGVEVLPFPGRLERLGDSSAAGFYGTARLGLRALSASASAARYLVGLRRVLGRLAPDVIHSHGLKTHVLAAWAAPRGAAIVWHVHDYAGRRPLMSRLLKLSARRASLVVANSRSVAADVAAVCGARAAVRTIHNAVDLRRFAPGGRALDLDAASGLRPAADGAVRVGLVATLARWKGHRTFLEALARLPETLRVRGYVVGGALYRTERSQQDLAELRRAARELGLEGRVGFAGFVADAAEAMRALDVVVHCSTEPEPFGLVIAEAMACGRAVVASRAGGARELVSDGHDALTHAPGDATELAARVRELATDAGLRARLGRAARLSAERRFDRARMVAEWLPLYRHLRGAEESLTGMDGMNRIKEVMN
jgi:glycosyltransferase involved in cell wall biosynthesis